MCYSVVLVREILSLGFDALSLVPKTRFEAHRRGRDVVWCLRVLLLGLGERALRQCPRVRLMSGDRNFVGKGTGVIGIGMTEAW